MKRTFLLALIFVFCLSFGQTSNIIEPEKIENSVQKNHLNEIMFLDKAISLENTQETDLLKSMTFQEDKDLDIRVFQDNSLVNYLHQLNPSLTADELLKKGNYQFTFYVDGKIIYIENLNSGAGTTESKKLKTTFRIPLMSSKNEDSWGKFLWSRFYLTNNGIDALNDGNHVLKIEIRPYLKTPTMKTGNIIAQGEINLVVPKKYISEQRIVVQKIKPNSGWKVSNEKFNQEKIRALNTKIAENRFRDITSIVVIKNGKLLLEEYFNKYNRDSLNDTRSVGKSLASALMGIAVKDGYIKNEDQKISEFYDLKTFKNFSSQKNNVTIKSLLTMSSGFEGNDQDEESPGNEENMYPTENWIKFILDLPMTENKIGETWNYFTAGVVLSGDILDQSVPKGLKNYADKKLFQPLGITNYNWQFTPQQKPSLAGGLRMNTLDFAKFGQLYKNNGIWNGKTILDKNWIKKTFTNYFSNTPDFEGYGYLFWRKIYTIGNKSFETYQSSGNGGNKIIMFTELPIVMVITAKAYNQPYSHSQVDKIVQEYLLPAVYK
ncbi:MULTISPECIES: serine hydrolase domain-containing protein [Chryseobacterium]|uniref:serine hydrolase domain-containing protein n=1 Tax=Chryseobacterium TaxID=59732 RepID=UPI00195BE271|nr:MULTISPECIES: serine hydrolase [Chryseobacterium]MBM7419122.1 CubicO group peptidase (beta-lactamase class C family) [Chryseobacterium sp. JUb44]MDH6209044.1 CubicO group peptidase (beta-lactamase class C family) [Chryseobacterium sp. BIGb0186]WSO11898.1 serine hydrolase [Chryseobacterium scophthalmum]